MHLVNVRNLYRIGLVLMSVALLFGCKGEQIGPGSGSLVLSITDAPVDTAEQVVVEFSGVEIQPENGDRIQITYANPKTINLLALQGGLRATLIENLTLDVGGYSWIRLKVNAVEGDRDSYIVIGGNEFELHIPSGAQTGLKLNTPFHVNDGEILDFTIDFDLRKSVHQPVGQKDAGGNPIYYLRPTLRLLQTKSTGTISGVVNTQIFSDELNCSANEAGYAVYLFQGNVTPDDMDGIAPDPITTAMVTAGNSYAYTLAYLEPGVYTIAATCMADLDAPDTDDNEATDVPPVTFVHAATVNVSAGVTTPYDLLP